MTPLKLAEDSTFTAMDYALSLERAAHTCPALVQDLELSTARHASALTRGGTESTNNSDSRPSLRGPLIEPDKERAEIDHESGAKDPKAQQIRRMP